MHVVRYWKARLRDGMQISVPERRVRDARRALLVQNLGLTWRYSLGNPYEQFSFPEGVDVAQVLDAHGHGDVAAAMLRTSLTRGYRRTPTGRWDRSSSAGRCTTGSDVTAKLSRP